MLHIGTTYRQALSSRDPHISFFPICSIFSLHSLTLMQVTYVPSPYEHRVVMQLLPFFLVVQWNLEDQGGQVDQGHPVRSHHQGARVIMAGQMGFENTVLTHKISLWAWVSLHTICTIISLDTFLTFITLWDMHEHVFNGTGAV